MAATPTLTLPFHITAAQGRIQSLSLGGGAESMSSAPPLPTTPILPLPPSLPRPSPPFPILPLPPSLRFLLPLSPSLPLLEEGGPGVLPWKILKF